MTKLRLGDPVVIGDLKIVPVEAICCHCCPANYGFCISAFKGPAYVIDITPSETRAFDMAGAEVDAEVVTKEIHL